MIRNLLLKGIIVAFFAVGAIDIFRGDLRTGVASVLLGIVNGLLLWGDK
jgi:hypothetical protein